LKKFFRKVLDHLNGQAKNITSAAFLLALTAILSGFLGLIRDRLLAGTFGAGDDLDVYYAAFRLPDLVFGLLIASALSGGFIPVFTGYLKKKDGTYEADKDAWYLANNILNIFLTLLIFICLILAIFAPGLVVLLTPGFSPEKMEITIKLTRIIFLETFLLGISGIFGAILQSFKRFFLFSLTSAIYNLGIIFGILFFAPKLGITGVVYGVVIGAFLHMAIQLPAVIGTGYRYRKLFDFYHSDSIKILRLMVPRSLTLGIAHINYLAMTMFSSSLAVGSLAIFNLAFNMVTLPEGIIGASFAIAAFPTLCEAFNNKHWHKFKEALSLALRQMLFLTAPLVVFLTILNKQIVGAILGMGKFNLQDINYTAQALQYFAPSLLFDSLTLLLVRAFLARKQTWRPVGIMFVGALIRIFFAIFLKDSMGVSGLTLAFTLGGFLNFALLWVFLKKEIKDDLDEKRILISVMKILISCFFVAITVLLVIYLSAPFINSQSSVALLAQLTIACLFGVTIYIVSNLMLKSTEMMSFWNSLIHHLPWRKIPVPIEMIDKK